MSRLRLFVVLLAFLGCPEPGSVTYAVEPPGFLAPSGNGFVAPEGPSKLHSARRDAIRSVRRWVRGSVRMIRYALQTWWRWLKRVSGFLLIALVVPLFDRKLLAAWRREGLGPLSTYVPLVLYSYFFLLFSRRSPLPGKILLVLSLLYGALRNDLVRDRHAIPGLVDDTLVIAVATWLFLSSCSPRLHDEAARRALRWRRRMLRLQRSRRSARSRR